MRRRLIVFLSILLFFAACNMPGTRIYSLHLPNSPIPLQRGGDGGFVDDASLVIIVNSARYLAQPYIAYRSSPYQLEISRYSRWDASPRETLSEVFKDAMSSAGIFKEVRVFRNSVPDGSYALRINLKGFERLDEGDDSFGYLVFDVILTTPEGKKIYQRTISKRVRLDGRDFLGLARGLSSALSGGVDEVRSGIYSILSREP